MIVSIYVFGRAYNQFYRNKTHSHNLPRTTFLMHCLTMLGFERRRTMTIEVAFLGSMRFSSYPVS